MKKKEFLFSKLNKNLKKSRRKCRKEEEKNLDGKFHVSSLAIYFLSFSKRQFKLLAVRIPIIAT